MRFCIPVPGIQDCRCFLFLFGVLYGFSDAIKNLPANAGDADSTLGSGTSLGGGNGNPLQYPCLGDLVDRGNWRATVHEVTKSWT